MSEHEVYRMQCIRCGLIRDVSFVETAFGQVPDNRCECGEMHGEIIR